MSTFITEILKTSPSIILQKAVKFSNLLKYCLQQEVVENLEDYTNKFGHEGEIQQIISYLETNLMPFINTTIILGRGIPIHHEGRPTYLKEIKDGMSPPFGYSGFQVLRNNFLKFHKKLNQLDWIIRHPMANDPDWIDLNIKFGPYLKNLTFNHNWLQTTLENYVSDLHTVHSEFLPFANLKLYETIVEEDHKENFLESLMQKAGNNNAYKSRLLTGLMALYLKGMESDVAYWTLAQHIYATMCHNYPGSPQELLTRHINGWIITFQNFRKKVYLHVSDTRKRCPLCTNN